MRIYWVSVLATIIITSTLLFVGNTATGRSWLLGATRPIVWAAAIVGKGAGSLVGVVFGVLHNFRDVERLQQEVAALRAEVAAIDELRQENQGLRIALGRLEEMGISAVIARVQARVVQGGLDALVIDAGAVEGVAVNAPVLITGDIYIGRILRVEAHTATVILLSATKEKTEVRFSKAAINSVAEGRGLSIFEVDVPSGVHIEKDETLWTTGPRPFVVGFVAHVDKSDAKPFQTIRSSLSVAIADMEEVYIVKMQ